MENAISNLAVKRLIEEIKEEIEGRYLDKVQQIGKNTFRFKLTPGTKDLLIEPGKRINVTRYRIKAPQKPSQAALIMRKQLSNQKIDQVKQKGFDRVVQIDFTTGKSIIAELFGKGNIVITDEEGKVTYNHTRVKTKNRELEKGKNYQPPTSKILNPFTINLETFKENIKRQKNVVSTLAKTMGLGGPLSEHIFNETNIENKEELTEEEKEEIYEVMKEVINRKPDPVKQQEEIRLFPLEGEIQEKYQSINQAIDENYKQKGNKDEQTQKKIAKLENRLKQQQKSIKKFREKVKENKKKGDLIYENYGKVSKVIESFRKGQYDKLKELGAEKKKGKILLELE